MDAAAHGRVLTWKNRDVAFFYTVLGKHISYTALKP